MNFGENVAGYPIPVLNEREIRAAAGIMFLATFISLMLILFEGNFIPIKYVLLIFLTDFSIRIFVSPKFAPILIVGRMIVSNQNPEYVGAEQKKFAWYIGLVLSATMFVLMVIVNSFSYITGVICLLCLILMFFETAFGICIGCRIYKFFNKQKVLYCPGEVCDPKAKQDIQKISNIQLTILSIFLLFVLMVAFMFGDKLKKEPADLFEKIKTERA